MTTRAIFWGDGYENTLVLGELYNPVTDRPERAGSSHDTDGAGADVAWIEGRDYTLDADIRWVPDVPGGTQTPISGPVAFQAFLDWSRNAGAFRFVPDVTVPAFYLDGCYLVEPRKGFGNFENIKRSVHLTIRNPSIDFHAALRGLMFEYAPGSNISSLGLNMGFTRATAATYRSLPGAAFSLPLGISAASGVHRDRHHEVSTRTLLSEAARTQLVTQPENFGAWTPTGTIGVTGGQADPFGGTAAYLLDSNAPAAGDGILSPTVTFTADATKCVLWFMRAGTSTQSRMRLIKTNGTPTNRQTVNINWSGGVPTLAQVGGGGSGTLFAVVPMGAGWYALATGVDGVLASDTNRIDFFPDNTGTGGSVYLFGVNSWNADTPSSYQGPSLGTRNADVLTKSWPWNPQASFLYYEGVWKQPALNYSRYVHLGQFSGNVRLMLYGDASNFTMGLATTAGGSIISSTVVNSGIALGDTFRVLGIMQSDGKVKITKSINGGAESSGSLSAALAFPDYYSRPSLDIGNEAGTIVDLQAIIAAKIGPLVFNGVTVDTIAKAVVL